MQHAKAPRSQTCRLKNHQGEPRCVQEASSPHATLLDPPTSHARPIHAALLDPPTSHARPIHAFSRVLTRSHAFSRLPTPSHAFPRLPTPSHALSRLLTPSHAFFTVGDALECVTTLSLVKPRDLVLINAGVHHALRPRWTIPENVRALAEWLRAGKPNTRPCVVWRESLPQHFVTLDGTFFTFHRCAQGSTSSPGCGPISAAGLASGQRYNLAALAALNSTHIPVAKVFAPTAPFWWEHPGCLVDRTHLDCTHVQHLHSATHTVALCASLEELGRSCGGRGMNAL